jgi:uncharacterized protein YyaL (SSP411 family)
MRSWAQQFIPAMLPLVASHTRFAGWGSAVFVTWLDGPREVAIVDAGDSELRNIVIRGTAPGMVYSFDADTPLLQHRKMISDEPTAYVCRGFVCDAPTNNLEVLRTSIGVFS